VHKWELKKMAEENKKEDAPKEDLLLVAEVRALLLNGDIVELLPFKHERDVRAEVNKFIEDWVKTGFLLKENYLYPWNQVKQVEVVSVKALTHAEAQPYLEVWQRDMEAQKLFWKTRKPQAKDGDEKNSEETKK
jgi:hypothetical protein